MRKITAKLNGRIFGFLGVVLVFLFVCDSSQAEDGYRLWLRYDHLSDAQKLSAYKTAITEINLEGESPTLGAAREELSSGLAGLLGTRLPFVHQITRNAALILGTPQSSKAIAAPRIQDNLNGLGEEGFLILTTTHSC